MKMPVVEFSRPFQVSRVSPGGSFEKLNADRSECEALAKRYGIPAVHSVKAELEVKPWRGGGLKVKGEISCELDVVSVVSLEVFRESNVFPVQRYYLPETSASGAEDDVDAIVGGHIYLGERVAETIALELDPYPRKPGEAFAANDNAG